MPRKPIIYSNEHPYHITARSNNKDWFDLPLNYCYQVFSKIFIKLTKRYNFELHAFVLMNNHFHMIISTPEKNLSSGMRYFMTETSRGLRLKSKRINHVYGGRYKPCLIATPEYYAACIKYVYRNPVKAGIVSNVEDYKWSTISNLPNRLNEIIVNPENGHNSLLPIERSEVIKWYNQSTSEIENTGIRLALKKTEFKLTQQKNTGKHILITPPY